MRRLHDLSALAQHYTGLFGSRGLLLLADQLARRALPPAAYRPIQRRLWPTRDEGRRTNDHDSQFPFRNPKSEIRNWFSSRFPNAVEQKIAAADQICDHVFDFLGSGPTHWGDPIDWHQDVKSGHRWPVKFYTDYGSDELMPGKGVDVKIPWELSRLHHFVTLAQAWWLTGEQRYAEEFFAQWESWLAANPWLYGINWTCTMEVAIRAVNLIWARALLADAPGWASTFHVSRFTFQRATLESLRQHGLFIEHNLEVSVRDGRIVAANHYLANICGLACLGLCCPELPDAGRWRRAGLKALEQEMKRQVLPDGFFFESSTSYHRLAVELFLIPALLARRCEEGETRFLRENGFLTPAYWQRLEQMMEVILYITRPDGCVPQIGDNDDGRLLILSRYPDWPRHDHRYLLAVGAVLFGRGDFKAAALTPSGLRIADWGLRIGDSPIADSGFDEIRNPIEEVFWLLGREGVEQFDALKPDPTPLGSRAFPHAGLYVIRSQDNGDYALVRTSTELRQDKETRGQGDKGTATGEQQPDISPSPLLPLSPSQLPTAHAHNDALSLELWVGGQPVFVDPGTYCYTSDLEARNLFRSTAAHNTVMVDGQEINRIPPDEPFRLERDARVRVLEWCVGDDEVRLVAEYDGDGCLARPVVHRRSVRYMLAEQTWLIEDLLQGAGKHAVEARWHFTPGMEPDVQTRRHGLAITVGGLQLDVAMTDVDQWSYRTERSWISPAYGVKQAAPILTMIAEFRSRCKLQMSVAL